jgi:TonB-linked SusC/RagA family outer membrane protein
LYIIDGNPTQNPLIFNTLTPSSIESIQVLKDASASSIYGSRAANGVIIVTTKDGSSKGGEALSIQLNSSIGIASEKPQRFEMMNAVERGEALWRGSVNDKTNPNSPLYTFDWNGDFDNPVLNNVTPVNPVGGNPLVPAGDTDWQDVTYKQAIISQTDLSLSAASDNSSILVNMGYVKNTGIMEYTNYDRYSARVNANTSFFQKKLKFGINTELAVSNQLLNAFDLGGSPTPNLAITLAPTIPVYQTDGKYAGPTGGGYSDRNNPLHMQDINKWDNLNRTIIFGNIYLEAQIAKNLFFKTSLNVDYNNALTKDIEVAFQEGFLGRSINSLNNVTAITSNLTWSNTLRYEYTFGKSVVGFIGGIETIESNYKTFSAFKEGFTSQTEDFFYLDAGSGRNLASGNATGYQLLSLFGKINYVFNDKYLATVTLRRDGSSRFGVNNRYGFFPAATIGWRIVNESFMENQNVISDLKLRAGYGTVGNQNIGDAASLGLYAPNYGTISGLYTNTGTAYDLSGVNGGTLPSGFVSIQAPNPDLKWETTAEFNFGLDFELFGSKLYGSLDVFTRKITGILIQPPVASAIGAGQLRWVNGASKSNKGFEMQLGYRGKVGDFTYNVIGNVGQFVDKITELPEEVRAAYPGNSEKSIVGHSQLSLFGYRTDGIFKSQSEVDAHATQPGKGIGRIKYVDLNADGIINALDQDWLGTVLPKFEYGIRVDLGYKNFDLQIFGSGISGRTGTDPGNGLFNRLYVNQNNAIGLMDAYSPQNPNSDKPMLSLTDSNNEGRASDFFIVSTSYFKMRNIQLGYTLPAGALKAIKVQSLRVFVMGENLFWTKSSEFLSPDPELVNFGNRTNSSGLPVPTTYTFGFNLNF